MSPRGPELGDVARLASLLQADVGRSVLRARNGIKHVAGIDREQVSPTPRRSVWQSGKARLWRYRPDDRAFGDPVVIVYSLVSRSYVLDLNARQSFVSALCDAGIPVYLLDWGIADEADAHTGTHVYVEERIPAALNAALADSGAERASLLGYCLGGVLALLALARRPRLPVRSLIAMATPVDFAELGLMTELLGAGGRIDPVSLLDHSGNVPPEAARDLFRVMKPTSSAAAYANLLDNLWNDEFLRSYQTMNQWTRDHVPFPGRVLRELVQLLFHENALVEDTAHLRGRRASLRWIDAPTLVLAAEKDHIIPLAAARPLADLLGSDETETVVLPSGHIGLVTGGVAVRRTLPTIIDWLAAHGSGRARTGGANAHNTSTRAR